MSNETRLAERPAEQSATVYAPKQGLTMWSDTDLFNQTFKMSTYLAKSELVPPSYKDKPENCMIAIDICNRMGLSPISVMQNSQVVRNKFSWTGSACKSMIDSCGKYKKTTYVQVGQRGSDSWGFFLRAIDKDGEVIDGVTVTVEMAKREGWYNTNPKWQSMTELMLKYRCAAFFMRTECASLAMGFLTAEENEDIAYNEAPTENIAQMLDAEEDEA